MGSMGKYGAWVGVAGVAGIAGYRLWAIRRDGRVSGSFPRSDKRIEAAVMYIQDLMYTRESFSKPFEMYMETPFWRNGVSAICTRIHFNMFDGKAPNNKSNSYSFFISLSHLHPSTGRVSSQ